jgi:hypothetical protein
MTNNAVADNVSRYEELFGADVISNGGGGGGRRES